MATWRQKLIQRPSRWCGPDASSALGATTGAPRSLGHAATASSRPSRSRGLVNSEPVVATLATTGAGRR